MQRKGRHDQVYQKIKQLNTKKNGRKTTAIQDKTGTLLTEPKADNEIPSHSYGVSLAIWDHTETFHPTQVNTPCLNPSQTGLYSIYLPRRDGRL